MSMATVRFFVNNYYYPDYQNSIQPNSEEIECTPKGTSTRGGTLHLAGSWGNLSRKTYMRITRDGVQTWAWIDNVRERTANSVEIEYTVDPYRTYRSRLKYGKQFVVRSPKPT